LLEGGQPARALSWIESSADGAAHLLGDICQTLGREAREPARRQDYLARAVRHYEAAFSADPANTAAGRQLALLLALDRGEPEAALALAGRLRQGRSGERLSIDLVDALATIYHAAGRHSETLTLCRE